MAYVRSCFLAVVAGLLSLGICIGQPHKFYADDPIQAEPKPLSVGKIKKVKVYAPFDYVYQTGRQKPRASSPAMGINTLGDVPDNAWFTNRHGRHRMSLEALKRGAGNENAPQPPFRIVSAKTEGITPGFQMVDARGRLYFVKSDPKSNPELSTGAEVVTSKFFYAIGYNTPENYLVRIGRSDWTLDEEAKITGANGIRRRFTSRDFLDVLGKAPRFPDGSFRVVASLAIPGKDLGPFRYEGTPSDDPNDLIPHENRRGLRGLLVFCSWLNHTDAKSANTYNTLVIEDGVPFVRHYLIDFGSALGSDGDRNKDARFGNEYQIPDPGSIFKSVFGLGLFSPKWERAAYPKEEAVGRIESSLFDPERWKPNYPNPAFLSCRPDDEYWAAKIVLAFSDADIHALVETGGYSDPRTVDYLVATLSRRRDQIGRTYLSKILPLDRFEVRNNELLFEDLGVQFDFRQPRQYKVSWYQYDNQLGTSTILSEETSFLLPRRFFSTAEGGYFAARINAVNDESKTVTAYLRKKGPTAEVVGLEREW
jgi:hypothetical protein